MIEREIGKESERDRGIEMELKKKRDSGCFGESD